MIVTSALTLFSISETMNLLYRIYVVYSIGNKNHFHKIDLISHYFEMENSYHIV